MKAFCFSLFTLVILLALVSVNSIYIERFTNELVCKLDEIDEQSPQSAKNELEELAKEFESAEKIISLTVSHSDLTNIEEAFAEIVGAASANDSTTVTITKSRLKSALLHLGRLSGINIHSII